MLQNNAMKICIVHRYPLHLIPSTNPSFHLFLYRLIKKGHDVHLVTFKNKPQHPFTGKIIIHDNFMNLERKNSFEMLFKSLFFVFWSPIKVFLLNARYGFDIIYCDDSFPLYEIFIKLLTRKKVLIRRGDLMCAYLLEKYGILGKLIFNILFAIEKFTWKRADSISVITESFKRFMEKYGVEAKKIRVIEDGIDFDLLSKETDSITNIKTRLGINGRFVAMFHGVMMGIKGIEVFIRAIPSVISIYPDARFVLVGEGEEREALQNLTASLGIKEYVIFTGWVDYERIAAYIKSCDVGITMRKDTLANRLIVTTALLQYWACGKPVIAPGLSAIEDIVKDGENGFIFDPGSAEDLSKKLILSIKSKDQLSYMGDQGRKLALSRYNTSNIADKMADFIEKEASTA